MYVKLFDELLKEKVEFLILGGGAVCLHGFGRMTVDIDIILKNSRENIRQFVSAASRWGQGCASGLDYDDFQGPGCLRILEDFPLDVFTVLNGKRYEDFIGNAVVFSLNEGLKVQCLSISDLIELKQGTLHEKDQLDVTVLRRLQAGGPPEGHSRIHLETPSSPAE